MTADDAAVNRALESGDTNALLDIFGPGLWFTLVAAWIAWVAFALYNGVYRVAKSGQTLGDRVVHVRKVVPGRFVPTGGVAFLRWLAPVGMSLLAGLIPFGLGNIIVLLDYLWAAWDPQSQTLHDKMVGTFVEDADLAGPPRPRH